MTREQRCALAIERGFTYDSETGLIYSRFGNHITSKYIDGYIQIKIQINKKVYQIKGHQFAWFLVNKECVNQIDHINGIKDDNRICNLRSVTNQQNCFNRTNAKGYTWNKRHSKWMSKIKVNSKTINLGYYNTEQEARNAYLAAKEIYHKF